MACYRGPVIDVFGLVLEDSHKRILQVWDDRKQIPIRLKYKAGVNKGKRVTRFIIRHASWKRVTGVKKPSLINKNDAFYSMQQRLLGLPKDDINGVNELSIGYKRSSQSCRYQVLHCAQNFMAVLF